MTAAAPVLETERLVLRAHTRDDLPDVLATWSDPDVVRFIGGRGATEEEAWQRLLRYAGSWPLLGYGFWRIGDRGTGAYLGDIGFFQGCRGLGERFDRAPECGWTLASHVHGRGYATEAVRAVHAWGDVHLPAERTVCMIDPGNAPSQALAAKFGYVEFARSTYKDVPTMLFERVSGGGTPG
jgi:RimJ/RimL family protein N-acetyltransferase